MLAIGVTGGLFFGILKGQFFGRLNPTDKLFNNRYIITGIFWGLMILAVNMGVQYSGSGSLDFVGFIIECIISFGIGIAIAYFAKARRIQKQKERIDKESNATISCCDFAKFKDESDSEIPGYFVLGDNAIWFQSKSDEEMIRLDPTEVQPTIVYRSWFNIPTGLNLNGNKVLNLKFPCYWKSKIQQLSA